jgi:heme-degrading monooxygenase HmoA
VITEIVEFQVKPGTADDFIAALKSSQPIFKRSAGFISLELHHCIENPLIFVLLIMWDSVASHVELFQKSADFGLWRAAVGKYFAEKPRLQHTETKISY